MLQYFKLVKEIYAWLCTVYWRIHGSFKICKRDSFTTVHSQSWCWLAGKKLLLIIDLQMHSLESPRTRDGPFIALLASDFLTVPLFTFTNVKFTTPGNLE